MRGRIPDVSQFRVMTRNVENLSPAPAPSRVTTLTAPQGRPSIEDDPNARIDKPGSDHAVATFVF
jgi:hypothetical protein